MSPLQRQLLPIQIGNGIDTKTNDKKVLSTKLLTLENGIFTNPGEIEKRNGYQAIPLVISGGGTIVNPQAIKTLKNELVCAAQNSNTPGDGRLFSFSEDLQAWVDKGKYVPTKVTTISISADIPQVGTSGFSDGRYVVSAWTTIGQGAGPLYYTISDTTTGTFLVPETLVDSNASNAGGRIGPAVVLLAANKFGIFYVRASGGVTQLRLKIVTISGTTVSLGASLLIINNLRTGTSNTYSAMGTSTGAAVSAWTLSNNITTVTIDSSGTVTHTATFTSPPPQLYINVDPTGNIWVYVCSNTLRYAVYSSTLTPILAFTDTGLVAMVNVSVSLSATQQTVYYYDSSTGTVAQIYSVIVDTSGIAGTPVQFAAEGFIFSDPIQINGRTYLPLLFRRSASAQMFYAFLDVVDGQVIATALAGSGQININNTNNPILPINRPFSIAAGTVSLVVSYLFGPLYPNEFSLPLASTLLTLDFVNPDLYQAVAITDSLIWNGGVITDYDGQPATELGYFLFPEVVSAVVGSGGQMADGQYQYQVVYEWYDNNGRFHQSAPSIPTTVVVSGGGGVALVTLTIKPLTITAKQFPLRQPVQIVVYRTLSNGTVFHVDSDPSNAKVNTPFADIVYVTGNADSVISSNGLIYTTGGVVDNIIPPAGLQMTIYNSRLWIVDSEAANTVWYSKTVTPGIGLSFSDLLTANIDQRQGEITGLAAFDDKIVYFKKTVPFFSVGDGANDLGLGATLSLSQIVSSDVGCNASKSIILNMPIGVMFKSDKGIYLMDRSLQVQYIGREVEAFNSQTITSANLIDTKSQIRFLCSDGVELVYDYIYAQWSTFTNHLGFGADIWQGNYTYARVDGDIYNETPGVFVDKAAAISLKIGTAWLKLTEIQNYERLRRLFVIGNYKSPHVLHGQVYFDYEATVGATFQFNPQNVLGLHGDDLVYQFRYHMERQKCESARFVIFDDFTGLTPGEGYSLSQLSIEAGIKQGGNKLSPYKSVG